MHFWTTPLLVAVALSTASALLADLEFESPDLALKPKSGEKTIAAEFKFKNTGTSPVTITRVHSGCGCTVLEKPVEPIAPGASGSIPVVYKPGDQQGPQSQLIGVETADGKTHRLRLSVDLPVRISFAPRLLLFRGDDAEARTAVITFGGDEKLELLGVAVQSPAFELIGEPALENRVLKLTLRHVGPPDADARASVRIRTRDGASGEHTDILYLRHASR